MGFSASSSTNSFGAKSNNGRQFLVIFQHYLTGGSAVMLNINAGVVGTRLQAQPQLCV